ncbi:radical SAM protein [Sorangium sp. So ce1335]|uniref:radical SAM protein n=1 Tax=Sorangium sp. So ce1335 TaxID=3133335 RepID=UPI003F5EBEF2
MDIGSDIIVKVAAYCNLYCTYCHWFRNDAVEKLPKLMPQSVEDDMAYRLERLFEAGLHSSYSLVLHGGEPLLYGKGRTVALVRRLRAIAERTKTSLFMGMTTNGVLIDDDWCAILKDNNMGLAVSIDGPREVHDKSRVDRRGRGSHAQVVAAIERLQKNDVKFAILSVADLETSSTEIMRYFADELGVKTFDVLIPNFNHDDVEKGVVKSIGAYYRNMFDLWYQDYSRRGVSVRLFESMIKALLNQKHTSLDSTGPRPTRTIVIQPNGAIEPHDVFGIAGQEQVHTKLNVSSNDIVELWNEPAWRIPYEAGLNLPAKCKACRFTQACSGGYIMHRYSSKNGYNNPSVYCEDLLGIFSHIWKTISQDIYGVTAV